MEVEAIGHLREGIVPCKPRDLFLSLAPLGDVLLQVHPAAVGERLVCDQYGSAIAELLRVRERLTELQLGNVLLDPLALVFPILRGISCLKW
jgi:hypothetical protein